jgi:hypothetical protein
MKTELITYGVVEALPYAKLAAAKLELPRHHSYNSLAATTPDLSQGLFSDQQKLGLSHENHAEASMRT